MLLRMRERRHDKLQAPWAGPYLVVDHAESDAGHPKVCLQHLASKKIGDFPLSDLKRCNLDQYADVEAALPFAAMDNFEYKVSEVLTHRPAVRQGSKGKRLPKSSFEFLVRWADLPEDEENPSWEPWSNASLRACEAYRLYCKKDEVIDQLGSDFYVDEADEGERATKGKRKRS